MMDAPEELKKQFKQYFDTLEIEQNDSVSIA